uniref:Lipase domain-containing protein n=1 Tax=Anopheles epiroticus TaxID=199890 RepID=A0A182PC85_9DIPT
MKSCIVPLTLLLVTRAVSGEPRCSAGRVAVPKDTESFECITVEELQHQKLFLEGTRRFEAESATRFLLWTQSSGANEVEELRLNDLAALQNSTFDIRSPTRILIHGWLNDWKSAAVRGLAQAYVAKGAYNVIGIDWSAGASTIVYLAARLRVGAVADAVAKQIELLLRAGQHPSQIVLVGHSLGAHIAGLAGKHFQAERKLAAVIALDPAGPLFGADKPLERVDAQDAMYVEVIHTNKGLLGHRDALGQADFYPNGGRSQPGCLTNTCSHHQAVEYFRRTLTGSRVPLYTGRRCEAANVNDGCDGALAVMGGDLNDIFKTKMSGLFYLTIGK